jgi:hypothetical protein
MAADDMDDIHKHLVRELDDCKNQLFSFNVLQKSAYHIRLERRLMNTNNADYQHLDVFRGYELYRSTVLMLDYLYKAQKETHAILQIKHNTLEDALLFVERRRTFAMLTLPRVGKDSLWGRLPAEMIEKLFIASTSIDVDIADARGRYARCSGKWIEAI